MYPTYMGLPEKVGVVCYNEDSSSYQVNYEYWTDWVGSLLSFQLEVVGNIYDNPEMLENIKGFTIRYETNNTDRGDKEDNEHH